MRMKKGIFYTSIIIMVLSLGVIAVAINVINVFRVMHEDAADKMWPSFNKFKPYNLNPSGPAATVDNSIRALICGIEVTVFLDNWLKDAYNGFLENNPVYEKKFMTGEIGYGDIKAIILQNIMWRSLWSRVEACRGYTAFVDPSEISEGESADEDYGQKCRESGGICINTVPDDEIAIYEEGDCLPGQYCKILCPDPYKWRGKCQLEGEESCNENYAQVCMASELICGVQCTSVLPDNSEAYGCELQDQKVSCVYNSETIDIKEDLMARIKHEQDVNSLSNKRKAECPNGIYFGEACVMCEDDDHVGFLCKVKNFELPQAGKNIEEQRGFAYSFLDPSYLVFYEAFPEKESVYWQENKEATWAKMLFYGSIVASFVIPLKFYNQFKELQKVGDLMEALQKHTLIGKTLRGIFGIGSRFKSVLFLKSVKDPVLAAKYDIIHQGMKKLLAEKGVNSVEDLARTGARVDTSELLPLIRRNIDEASSTVSNEDMLINELANSIKDQLRRTGSPPPNLETEARELAQKIAEEIVTPVITAENINLAKARLSVNLGLALDDFLGRASRASALEEFLAYLSERNNNIKAVLDSSYLPREYLRHLKELAEELDGAYRFMEMQQEDIIFLREVFDGLSEDAVDNHNLGFVRTMKSMPILGAGIKTVDALTTVAISTLVPAYGPGKIFTLIGLYIYGDLLDSVSSKFMPHGENTLILKSPNPFGIHDTYPLQNAAPHVLVLERNNNVINFHLVSPCKADLTLKKAQFSRKLSTEDVLRYDIYNFGAGPITVRKGTLEYNYEIENIYKEGLSISHIENPGDCLKAVQDSCENSGGDTYVLPDEIGTVKDQCKGIPYIFLQEPEGQGGKGGKCCNKDNPFAIYPKFKSCGKDQNCYEPINEELILPAEECRLLLGSSFCFPSEVYTNPEGKRCSQEGREINYQDRLFICNQGVWTTRKNTCKPFIANEVVNRLNEIDPQINAQTTSKLDEIYNYAIDKYNEGDYEKAVAVLAIIMKYYPVSQEAFYAYIILDEFLSKQELFIQISPKRLREIAFEEFVPLYKRAGEYARYMEKSCDTPDKYYHSERIDYSLLTSCDELLMSGMGESQWFYTKTFEDFDNENSIYKVGDYRIPVNKYLFYRMAKIQKSDLYEKYAYSMLYANQDNLDVEDESKLEQAFTNEQYNELINRINDVFFQNMPIKFGQELDCSRFISDPVATGLCDYYELGALIIPVHVKYRKTDLYGSIVPEYPSRSEFRDYYLPAFREMESDTEFSKNSAYQLIEKKNYYESKVAALSYFDWVLDFDIYQWLNISLDLIPYTDSSNAVKEVTEFEEGSTQTNQQMPLNSLTLTTTGIRVNAKLDENYQPNYCFSKGRGGTTGRIFGITILSVFADDLFGTLAAFVCSPAGPLASAFCYGTASAATNFVTAEITENLNDNLLWPNRG